MTEIKLGIKERSAMLALMAAATEVSNPDLQKRLGFALDGAARRKVNDLKYVASRKQGRSFAHELTEEGWAWCREELSAECPKGAGSAGGALYGLLSGIKRYLDRSNLSLADMFKATVSASDIEALVRSAYHRLAREPRDFVSLTALKAELHGTDRFDVDDVLKQLFRSQQANLVPEDDQKKLTAADRAAAIHIGGEDKHKVSLA